MDKTLALTIKKIIDTYGIGIIPESKFWFVVSDFYSFASNHTLKKAFKECINKGYFTEIVSKRNSSKKTLSYISKVIDSEAGEHSTDEIAKCLFSVAIGIGSCNLSDYSDFIYNNSNIPSRAKGKFRIVIKDVINRIIKFKNILIFYVFGLICLYTSTIAFRLFLINDWWMVFVIMISSISIYLFCGISGAIISNKIDTWTDKTKEIIASLQMPIMIGFFLNGLLPFLFCIDSFRDFICKYFFNNSLCEGPWFFTLCIVGLVNLVIISFSIMSLCSKDFVLMDQLDEYSNKNPYAIAITILLPAAPILFVKEARKRFGFNMRIVSISTIIVLFGYLLLFVIPVIT